MSLEMNDELNPLPPERRIIMRCVQEPFVAMNFLINTNSQRLRVV